MAAANPINYRAQARILKALAHLTRLFIVDELACGDSFLGFTDGVGISARLPKIIGAARASRATP